MIMYVCLFVCVLEPQFELISQPENKRVSIDILRKLFSKNVALKFWWSAVVDRYFGFL